MKKGQQQLEERERNAVQDLRQKLLTEQRQSKGTGANAGSKQGVGLLCKKEENRPVSPMGNLNIFKGQEEEVKTQGKPGNARNIGSNDQAPVAGQLHAENNSKETTGKYLGKSMSEGRRCSGWVPEQMDRRLRLCEEQVHLLRARLSETSKVNEEKLKQKDKEQSSILEAYKDEVRLYLEEHAAKDLGLHQQSIQALRDEIMTFLSLQNQQTKIESEARAVQLYNGMVGITTTHEKITQTIYHLSA